jgi:hypothetical protein
MDTCNEAHTILAAANMVGAPESFQVSLHPEVSKAIKATDMPVPVFLSFIARSLVTAPIVVFDGKWQCQSLDHTLPCGIKVRWRY